MKLDLLNLGRGVYTRRNGGGDWDSPHQQQAERGAGVGSCSDGAPGAARRPVREEGQTPSPPPREEAILLACVGSVPVPQVIVWDPDLIQPMTLIAEATFIRKGGVTKMVRLPVTGLTERYEDASEFIFLVRPTLSIVDMVAEAIR